VAAIAYFQYRTTREKQRFDLYQSRFKVYQSTLNFLRSACSDCVNQPDIETFDLARNEAFFLFGEDCEIFNYLRLIREKAREYALLKSRAKEMAGSNDSLAHEIRLQRNGAQQWLLEQHDIVPDKFAAYLSFNNKRCGFWK
jgi:hypothetical protein